MPQPQSSYQPPATRNAGPLGCADESLYEVVNGEKVEQAPMGAYEVLLASFLNTLIDSFARDHQLGRAVTEMLFKLSDDVILPGFGVSIRELFDLGTTAAPPQ